MCLLFVDVLFYPLSIDNPRSGFFLILEEGEDRGMTSGEVAATVSSSTLAFAGMFCPRNRVWF